MIQVPTLRITAIRGFTLTELMVVIALVAILLGIAVPSFQQTAMTNQLRSSANNLIASARLARSEAFKRNAIITLCVSTNGTSCGAGNWAQGWIILNGTTVLDRQPAAPSGYRFTTANSTSSFLFQPTGAGTTTDRFTLCRATPSVGNQERVVSIDTTGRAWVTKTQNGSCP